MRGNVAWPAERAGTQALGNHPSSPRTIPVGSCLTNRHIDSIYETTHITQEAQMVTLSPAAKTQLDSYFGDKQRSPIRVYLSSGG